MIKKYISLFFKGMAMGAADVVPGVSGGTIAFITGIYEELIASLSAVDGKALQLLFKGKISALWEHVNGTFLAVLFAGIFTSILTLASLLSFLLEHHEILVWSFFFGLVAASVWMVGRTVKSWNLSTLLSFGVGTVVAYLVTIAPASTGTAEPAYLVLCGALAICAMILPGISGSFILLLLGAYGIVLNAVAERDLFIIIYVGIGAVIGLLTFTKALKWIFAKFYNATIALLTGFLLGSLNKLWPWKEVISTYTKHAGTEKEEMVPLVVENLLPSEHALSGLIFATLGALLVILLEWFGNKK